LSLKPRFRNREREREKERERGEREREVKPLGLFPKEPEWNEKKSISVRMKEKKERGFDFFFSDRVFGRTKNAENVQGV
jgi:hypothetical protein